MAKTDWTLDQLKSELSARKQVKGWIIARENIHRRERYFMMDDQALVADQDREVHTQNIQLRLFVHLDSRPGRQGEISKKLFPSVPLAPQLDSAIEAARQTDHQAWELPKELPARVPQVKSTDPRMAEDLERVMGELTERMENCVGTKRETRFNSAELFLSVHDQELHISNGLIHRSSQSRIYSEAAYSYDRPGRNGKMESDEYLNTRWAVTRDDLPVEELFDETSDRARNSLDTVKPSSGRYSVIVDADVLATLFNNQVTQLSSSNAYHGLPFLKPGDELIPGLTGEPITLMLDPSLEYGADTTALSETGLIQVPFKLVDKNRVIATSTDKRYSDYLNTPITTIRGNVVVEPGTLSHEELTREAPHVLEILQFSGLFSDPNSGTFSSEIRLAKLYDNRDGAQKVSWIKGGSLSGSFRDNFRGVRFSKNRVKRAMFHSNQSTGEGYYGPDYALLSDVSIVG